MNDSDLRVRVRVTDQGIRLELGDHVLAPSIEQARRMADAFESNPDKYGMGHIPEHVAQLAASLRNAADIYQAYCMGVFKPGDSGGTPS